MKYLPTHRHANAAAELRKWYTCYETYALLNSVLFKKILREWKEGNEDEAYDTLEQLRSNQQYVADKLHSLCARQRELR